MNSFHSQYVQLAIQEAWKYQLLTYPNPAVGATVVKNNRVLSVEAHHEAGLPHAEVLALKSAYLKAYPDSDLKKIENSHEIHNYLIKHHNNYFKECEIYVTLEPCNHIGKTPACAMLLESVGIQKVYIGTLDPNKQASGGKERLKKAGIEVITGINAKQTDLLLDPFLLYQSGHFVFFKMAMREDGTVDGGYITTQKSLYLVHQIRTKLDLMVIGGETVRVDRPTLDARFSKSKKSPDILIYSHHQEFDTTIPLFQVPNREVTISSSLEPLDQKHFVMIEGGVNLLPRMIEKIDYLLLFISHKEPKKNCYQYDTTQFSLAYSYFINDDDEILFLKKINAS